MLHLLATALTFVSPVTLIRPSLSNSAFRAQIHPNGAPRMILASPDAAVREQQQAAKRAYREAARRYHPDTALDGGDLDAFLKATQTFEEEMKNHRHDARKDLGTLILASAAALALTSHAQDPFTVVLVCFGGAWLCVFDQDSQQEVDGPAKSFHLEESSNAEELTEPRRMEEPAAVEQQILTSAWTPEMAWVRAKPCSARHDQRATHPHTLVDIEHATWRSSRHMRAGRWRRDHSRHFGRVFPLWFCCWARSGRGGRGGGKHDDAGGTHDDERMGLECKEATHGAHDVHVYGRDALQGRGSSSLQEGKRTQPLGTLFGTNSSKQHPPRHVRVRSDVLDTAWTQETRDRENLEKTRRARLLLYDS